MIGLPIGLALAFILMVPLGSTATGAVNPRSRAWRTAPAAILAGRSASGKLNAGKLRASGVLLKWRQPLAHSHPAGGGHVRHQGGRIDLIEQRPAPQTAMGH